MFSPTHLEDEIKANVIRPLNNILQQKLHWSSQLEHCSSFIRSYLPTCPDPSLELQMLVSLQALEAAARNDFLPLGKIYARIVSNPTQTSEELFFFPLLLTGSQPELSFIFCRLNERTFRSQNTLRTPLFVSFLASRLGITTYPPKVITSRVQGVELIQGAGTIRYAVFSDFLYGIDHPTSETDGGLLFSTIADDFLDFDLPYLHTFFPKSHRLLETLGVLNRDTLRFLFNMYAVLHDTLGHVAPYSMHHPTKVAAGHFLVDPMEELGADAQFFWLSTSEKTRPFISQVLTQEEVLALPILVLLKRVLHYTRRCTKYSEFIPRDLMLDGDARMSVLLWGFLMKSQILTSYDQNGFELAHSALPSVFEQLLDAWLVVEAGISYGPEIYSHRLLEFNQLYGCFDPINGQWEIPKELYVAFGNQVANTKS